MWLAQEQCVITLVVVNYTHFTNDCKKFAHAQQWDVDEMSEKTQRSLKRLNSGRLHCENIISSLNGSQKVGFYRAELESK